MATQLEYESGTRVAEQRRLRVLLVIKVVGGVAIACFVVFVLLLALFTPSLSRNRETANRVRCAFNLRYLDQAIRTYAAAHDGLLPASLAVLAKTTPQFDFDRLVCPSSTSEHAEAAEVLAVENAGELHASYREHCSYIYAGSGLRLSDLDSDTVIVYEPLDNHDQDGINVLFGDGVTDFLVHNRRRQDGPVVDLLAAHIRGDFPLRPFRKATTTSK